MFETNYDVIFVHVTNENAECFQYSNMPIQYIYIYIGAKLGGSGGSAAPAVFLVSYYWISLEFTK